MPTNSGAGVSKGPQNSFICIAALFLLTIPQLAESFSLPSLWQTRQHSRPPARLSPRQDDNDTLPVAISISPSQFWDGVDGPWSSFPLQVGSGQVGGQQNVRIFPSTAATAIWTIGEEGCPDFYSSDCDSERGKLFNPADSLTWAPKSIYQTGVAMNLGKDSSGEVGYDVVEFGWDGSGGPIVEHSIIWNLADSQYWLGVFGLNPRPTNFTTYGNGEEGFLQTLFDNGTLPSLSWAYTAGNQYRLNQVYGSLTLGGYDENRFEPNDVEFSFYEDISRDLSVNLHSITTDKGSPSDLLPDGSINIFIDSTVAELWLPESACDAFENAFGLEYDSNYNRYLLNSSHRDDLLSRGAEVTFTISPDEATDSANTVDITFPYAAFDLEVKFPIVINPNTSYYFPLQRADNSTQYTLGRTFLQEAYLIADYEHQNFSVHQCSWDEDKVSNQQLTTVFSPSVLAQNPEDSATDPSASEDTSLSTGAIAGIAIGAVAGVALVALAAFLFWRRRRNAANRKTAELEAKEAGANERKHDSASTDGSGKPVISGPMGGELDSGDINELPTSQKQHAQELDSPYRLDPNKVGYSEMEGTGYSSELDAGGKHPQGYFGKGGVGVNEMQGSTPVYEMPGSEVQEMPGSEGPKRFSWQN